MCIFRKVNRCYSEGIRSGEYRGFKTFHPKLHDVDCGIWHCAAGRLPKSTDPFLYSE